MRRLDNPALVPLGCCSAEKTNCPGHCNGKGHHPLTVTIGIGSKTPCLALATTNRRSPSMVGQSISVTEAFQLLAAFFNHLLRSRSSCFAESSQASIKMGEQFSRCLRGCFNAWLHWVPERKRKMENWFWCFFKCQMSNPGGWMWTRMLYVWDEMKILGGGVGGQCWF